MACKISLSIEYSSHPKSQLINELPACINRSKYEYFNLDFVHCYAVQRKCCLPSSQLCDRHYTIRVARAVDEARSVAAAERVHNIPEHAIHPKSISKTRCCGSRKTSRATSSVRIIVEFDAHCVELVRNVPLRARETWCVRCF